MSTYREQVEADLASWNSDGRIRLWPRRLALKVSDVPDIEADRSARVAWFESARDAFIEPLLDVASSAASLKDIHLSLTHRKAGQQAFALDDATPAAWGRLFDRLDQTDYVYVELKRDAERSHSGVFAGITAFFRPYGFIYVDVQWDGFLDAYGPIVQGPLVDLGKAAVSNLGGRYAEITLDRNSMYLSAHEELVGQGPGQGDASSATLARGYQWATVLTSGHLAQLGGAARVLREAPVLIAERVDGQVDAVYLQLSKSVLDVTDDMLLALKRYLRPILAPRRPGHRYFGPRLRFVIDPETEGDSPS